MEKFVPYEKMSKKDKRKIDQMRRGSWGDVNPVSRKAESKKVYNRKRTQEWKKELPEPVSSFCNHTVTSKYCVFC